jgi:hypothetical protein
MKEKKIVQMNIDLDLASHASGCMLDAIDQLDARLKNQIAKMDVTDEDSVFFANVETLYVRKFENFKIMLDKEIQRIKKENK